MRIGSEKSILNRVLGVSQHAIGFPITKDARRFDKISPNAWVTHSLSGISIGPSASASVLVSGMLLSFLSLGRPRSDGPVVQAQPALIGLGQKLRCERNHLA